MLKQAPLSSRGQLGDLLNSMRLWGQAVEIGTHRGEFAAAVLSTWGKGELTCVDPWECLPGYEDQQRLLWGEGSHYEAACRELRRFGGRAKLMRSTSRDAVWKFQDASLDFVYVDGDHRFAEVLHDLTEWWEKVRPSGILAGHDFVQPGESHSWAGEVQRALAAFVSDKSVDVQLIVEEGGLPWSYYLVK